MTFPSTGSLYHPGAVFELPGFDPDWTTVAKHEPQLIDSDGAEIKEVELPIGQGESLPFAAMLFLQGAADATVTLQVKVPEDSIGGFMVQGISNGQYRTFSYGADNFNTSLSDEFLNGLTGTLVSWHPIRIEGMVVAKIAGLIKVSVAGDVTIEPSSFIKGYRQHDSRPV